MVKEFLLLSLRYIALTICNTEDMALSECNYLRENVFRLLRYDPEKRLTAHEALLHEWFNEDPQPTPPELFPTWPAKSELGKAVVKSPITKPPANAKDVRFFPHFTFRFIFPL